MTIAAFRKPSLSVGASVVFGSALLLTSLAAPAFQAESSTGRSATAPVVKGATGRQLWRITDYTTIELVAREPGAPDNQHPWTVDPAALRSWLAQINVLRNGAPKPLFAADELGNIVPAITDALANARPDQDIALVSSGHHEDNSFFGITAVTARLFVLDGHLNLIVHDARVDFYDAARGSGMAPHFTIGSRASEGTWPIRSAGALNKRGDWLVLDSVEPRAPAPPVAPAAPAMVWRRLGARRAAEAPVARTRAGRGARAPGAARARGAHRRRAAPGAAQAPLRQGPDHQVRVRQEARRDHQGTLIAASAAAASDCRTIALAVAEPAAVLSKMTQGTAPAGHSARRAACCSSQRCP